MGGECECVCECVYARVGVSYQGMGGCRVGVALVAASLFSERPPLTAGEVGVGEGEAKSYLLTFWPWKGADSAVALVWGVGFCVRFAYDLCFWLKVFACLRDPILVVLVRGRF